MALNTSISELTLKDFIQCACYGRYAVLGEGTPGELQAAWFDILSQYYAACDEHDVTEYLQLVKRVNELLLHRTLMDTLRTILKDRYSHAAAKSLRDIYPGYQFSEQSFDADLKRVGGYETKNRIEYDLAVKQLAEMETKKEKDKVSSPEQQQKNLISLLFDINKFEGVKYGMEMTVLEFAIAKRRLLDYLERESINHGR